MKLLNFLKNFKCDVRLFSPQIGKKEYMSLDLSTSNKQLKNINFNSSVNFAKFINEILMKNNKSIAYGGYLEERVIYSRSSNFKIGYENRFRNIHLGIDLWNIEGAQVISPFEGKIHSFKNNSAFGDYGPTLILEHNILGNHFFTLYGHLSKESLLNFKIGKIIRSGSKIGNIGSSKVNGDYPPHLHFQIISDIGDYWGDYPGVCSIEDLNFYKLNCPNPNLILKLPSL